MFASRKLWIVPVFLVLAAVGCAQDETDVTVDVDSLDATSPHGELAGPDAGVGSPIPPQDAPGGTANELMAEVRTLDGQIGRAIQEGNYASVPPLAHRVEELVEAAAARSAVAASKKTELDTRVGEVRTYTGSLAAAAQAGNEAGAKEDYRRLQDALRAIENMVQTVS